MLWVLLMSATLAAAAWSLYCAATLDQLRRYARRTERSAATHEEETP